MSWDTYPKTGLFKVLLTSKGGNIAFPPPSPPCNVVPMFELPIENNKHPNFEWRGQGRAADSFVLQSYPIWIQCLKNFVADWRWKWAAVKKKWTISSITRVTKKFLEVSGCSFAKQRQRNIQKKVCCTCKVAFLLIIPIDVFSLFSLPSPLITTRFNRDFKTRRRQERRLKSEFAFFQSL